MLLQANSALIPLADASVHVIATSPPFWGLRQYAGDQGVTWPPVAYSPMPGLPRLGIEPMTCDLGLEPTPEAYVGHLVAIGRELWRVLRDDGVWWLNLGDGFFASGSTTEHANNTWNYERNSTLQSRYTEGQVTRPVKARKHPSLKPKDLCMIPARVALALQAEGWYLRGDVIWQKPNALPESVTDRPNKSHEYIFQLTKSPRYFYDHVAVRQAPAESSLKRIAQATFDTQEGGEKDYGKNGTNPNRSARKTLENFAKNPGRNLRSVWTIPTRASSNPHFAAWPPALVEIMLKASISEHGCCPRCGAQWKRVVRKTDIPHDGGTTSAFEVGSTANRLALLRQAARERGEEYNSQVCTLGFYPTCRCYGLPPLPRLPRQPAEDAPAADHLAYQLALHDANRERANLVALAEALPAAPAVVLDPFCGTGVTGEVAERLGAKFVGLDLGFTYLRDIAAPKLERVPQCP